MEQTIIVIIVVAVIAADLVMVCACLQIGKNSDAKMSEVEVKSDQPENWQKGQEAASELFIGSHRADIIAKAKTAAVFGKLLDMGLDPDDLKAAVDEVNHAY